MSDILEIAHYMAKDLHGVGAMDDITLRRIEELCLPEARAFAAEEIKAIRKKTRMSQAVFAALLNVGSNTVAQWEQGNRSPSGPSLRLLNVIDRKGVEAII